MQIMPIAYASVANQYRNIKKVQNQPVENPKNPTFKGFKELVYQSARKEIKSIWQYEKLFETLLEAARKEATSVSPTYLSRLTTDKSTLWTKLGLVQEIYGGVEVPVLSKNGEELMSIFYGKVRFNGGYNSHLDTIEYVDFELDNKLDYVLERTYNETRFYQNGNMKRYTKYTTDYKEKETTYYNEDGSENNFKNFLSSLNLIS